jgi:UDP-glucose:tetrahydrobiopterin glucosyltransferase
VQAIARLDEINRFACRSQAESEYSLAAFGDRLENWIADIFAGDTPSKEKAKTMIVE